MFKILQVRLQQYLNWEIPEVQAGFQKGRGTRGQIASIHWIIEKVREFQKNIYFYFIDHAKAFVWITINCGKFLKIWEYQTTLSVFWETSMWVKKQQNQTWNNWFKIGKGERKGCILSPCLFNLCAEYIMGNVGLDHSQARIKIAGRNINNLKYAGDSTLMAESKE